MHVAPYDVTTIVDAFADERRLRQVLDNLVTNALPHVFVRFWLADPARARSSSGSGLGLAIAAGLMDAMGGSIAVESELGEGTAFVVRVPA